jgi:hypothetical protein
MSRLMYDSIEATVTELPDGADLYAGYDDGAWPDADAIAKRFPGKTVIRTTANPADNEGDELDVERGDATPAQAPPWVARRRAAGHQGPLVYCSLSTWTAVKAEFTRQGVPEPEYRVAAYDNKPVIPAGAIGKQYASTESGGKNYDASVVVDYLPGIDPPPVPPPSKETVNMQATDPTTGGVWTLGADGHVEAQPGETGTPPYLGGLNNHPQWHAETAGPIAGFSARQDASGWGYDIAIALSAAKATGSWFAHYFFPRSGADKG